jgi:hypothetical protein
MVDVIFVVVTLCFYGACLLYIVGCDRLEGRSNRDK